MNPLQLVLSRNNFSAEESAIVCSHGVDEVRTIREIWAHWFAVHAKNDAEFIEERLDELHPIKTLFVMHLIRVCDETG